MGLQAVINEIRGVGGKAAVLTAEAFSAILQALSNTYADMGWFQSGNKTGIRKQILETNKIRIISQNNNVPVGEILEMDGQFVFRVSVAYFFPLNSATSEETLAVTNNTINILNSDGEIIVAVVGSEDGSGNEIALILGQSDAGNLNSFSLDSNLFWARILNTYKDAVDGDTIALLQAELSTATLSLKKGTDNEISGLVDAAAVVLTVKNASSDTTIKPVSVVTPRLGVGASAPATDGHANVGVYLGAAAASPSSGEKLRVGGNARIDSNLGIGMNPTRALDVTGDGKLTGTLEVDGAAQFDTSVTITPLAGGGVFVGQVGGTLSTMDAATARFALDVYSKAEVDAAIAAAIAAIVVDNALVGTPEEHSHSLS